MAAAAQRARSPAAKAPKQQELKIAPFLQAQGMETREQRDAIQQGLYSWLFNVQPVGSRTLRFLNGKGPTLYTAPAGKTIITYGICVISGVFYAIVFLSDGSATQVTISGGATTAIGAASTFYSGSGAYPAFSAFGDSGIIIVSPSGYWAWDGTTLYSANLKAPLWLTGVTTPSVAVLTLTGTATNGSGAITGITSTTGATVGAALLLPTTGFASGTTISTVNSSTEITLSNNYTGTTGTVTLTFAPAGTATNGSANITAMSSTAGIVIGMVPYGIASIANTVTVTAIVSSTEITLSEPYTGTTGTISPSINWPMPSGITGTAIEIYNSSPWIVNGRTILASAPDNGADFAIADGGVSVTVQDAYVQGGYTGLKQLDGFLYLFAPAAVDVISDVQTSGTPSSTTFLRVNVSPLVGSPWRDSIVALPSSIAFSNPTGVYEVAGGQAQKISDPFDGIFENCTFGTNPSACIVTLSEQVCYCLTLSVADPDTGVAANCLAMWDGKRWFLGSQETQPIIAATQDNQSSLAAWGSDGNTIFEMFSTPSATLAKKIKSWMQQGDSGITMRKMLERMYFQFASSPSSASLTDFVCSIDTESQSVAVQPISTVQWENSSDQQVQWTNSTGQIVTWSSFPRIAALGLPGTICLIFGVTIQSTIADLDIIGYNIGYIDYSRVQ